MRKSELKEIIKSAMLEEAQDSKKGNKEEQERMEGAIRDDRDHIKDLGDDIKDNEKKLAKLKKDFKDDVMAETTVYESEGESIFKSRAASLVDEKTGKTVKLPYETKDFRGDAITVTGFTEPHKPSSSGRIQTDQGEFFPGVAGVKIVGHKFESVNEAKEEEEEEVEITDTEEEVEVIDTEKEAPSLISSNDEKILNSLEAALSSAQELGDEKLTNQIGNTITFFTRQHIVKEEDLFEIKRMKRLAGILK